MAQKNRIRPKPHTIVIRSGESILVDAEDLPRLQKYNWYYDSRRGKRTGRVYATVAKTSLLLTRFLMQPKAHERVIRVDPSKPFDFRKCALKIVTHRDFQLLRPKTKSRTSSRFKGVHYLKVARVNKWRACINSDGKFFHLGVFATEEDAALAYNKAALRIFGEGCFLNEVD